MKPKSEFLDYEQFKQTEHMEELHSNQEMQALCKFYKDLDKEEKEVVHISGTCSDDKYAKYEI